MEGTGLFQDGVSARQAACRLLLKDDLLSILFNDEETALLHWDLRQLSSCHLNGASLIIKYGEFPHQTIECSGELAMAVYRRWSGNKIVRHAEGFAFKARTKSVIIFSILFILACSFIWLVVLPWSGERAALLVPKGIEIELGERLSGVFEKDGEMLDSASLYLQQFSDHLELDDTYTITAKVLKSEEINAFALPGGRVFVYSAIIEKMKSYEELVALLGHEVTHIQKQHSLKSICRSAATSIVIASLFGDVSGISSGIMSQADKFRQLDYSRDLESEADREACLIMEQNHVNPRGMVALLELLDEEHEQTPSMMKYLSTHPETKERIKGLPLSASPAAWETNAELERLFLKINSFL
jgi:beta-barrel assembly-enhancing protease